VLAATKPQEPETGFRDYGVAAAQREGEYGWLMDERDLG
jgi:hypothetical protein